MKLWKCLATHPANSCLKVNPLNPLEYKHSEDRIHMIVLCYVPSALNSEKYLLDQQVRGL